MPTDLNRDYFTVVKDTDHDLTIHINEGHNSNELLANLIDRGIEIQSYQEILPSLNEIFIRQVEGISYE